MDRDSIGNSVLLFVVVAGLTCGIGVSVMKFFGISIGKASGTAISSAKPTAPTASTVGRKGWGDTEPLFHAAEKALREGKIAQAEKYFLEVQQVLESQGAHPLETGLTHLGLGTISLLRGKYAEAGPSLDLAQAYVEKHLGPEHRTVADCLLIKGVLQVEMGCYDDAERLYISGMSIERKYSQGNSPLMLFFFTQLAELYTFQGRYPEADRYLKRADAIMKAPLESKELKVTDIFRCFAVFAQAQGHYADSLRWMKRRLMVGTEYSGPDHPGVAEAHLWIGNTYRLWGQYADAEEELLQARNRLEKAFGPDHPHVAQTLRGLGHLYRVQGRTEKAEPLFKQAAAVAEKALGPKHPDCADCWFGLGELARAQKKYPEADGLLKRALAIQEESLGPSHPAVALTLNGLGLLALAQDRDTEAASLFQRARTIQERKLDESHPALADTLDNQAALLRKQKKTTEAAKVEALAKSIRTRHAKQNPLK